MICLTQHISIVWHYETISSETFKLILKVQHSEICIAHAKYWVALCAQ